MIHLPRRSVTRFFIPMIDVLTLLFCVFLLLPVFQQSQSANPDREKATLGEDDLGSEEIIIPPGDTRTIKRELKKGAQFLGAVVLFRDIDRAKWRGIAPVNSSGPTPLTLRIAGVTATLASG